MTERTQVARASQSTSDRGLRLYNTMTRQKEPFVTIEPGVVRMYVCGVTVYDDAHIGHGMSAITFDMIRRYLEYLGYTVRHAQNFTDIDDKIIDRANREGIPSEQLTEQLIVSWLDEVQALNILPATVYPRATQEVAEIIDMIQRLIERDHAYAAGGDVYFRVRSFPDYGKLSNRELDDLLSGARIEIDERKSDPLDFALWKRAKPDEPQWPSPWGPGRPGWHIECSAMCSHHLDGVVDIHGGGADLIFPHHENEIAQSEAYLGTEPFARFWVHNGMVRIDGEKMSKSLGNFIPLSALIERGRTEALRLMVLQSHYRSPLNFTEHGLEAAQSGIQRLRIAARPVMYGAEHVETPAELEMAINHATEQFHASMLDDFDTPGAVAALFDLARTINRSDPDASRRETSGTRDALVALANILGLDLRSAASDKAGSDDTETLMSILIDVRAKLRSEKQFALADLVRDRLQEEGFILEDTKTGTEWKRA